MLDTQHITVLTPQGNVSTHNRRLSACHSPIPEYWVGWGNRAPCASLTHKGVSLGLWVIITMGNLCSGPSVEILANSDYQGTVKGYSFVSVQPENPYSGGCQEPGNRKSATVRTVGTTGHGRVRTLDIDSGLEVHGNMNSHGLPLNLL